MFEIPSTADITGISAWLDLKELWAETLGDPRVCVAVLDGPVDLSHPSFDGAQLIRLPTLVQDAAGSGRMSAHGTHITSVIFGQHDGSIRGIAPNCRGLIVPVFSDDQKGTLSQLDLARAINQAVEQGAHVINVSGGQLIQLGEADSMLAAAVRHCNDNGVLIVAAAGNDACQCLHVPAALPSVLAVGAMNAQGLPLESSNWGHTYQSQGVLAPGENILGAVPESGTARLSGTSFATPLVSGVAALLLSIQLSRGDEPNPHVIRDAILKSASPCNPQVISDCRRFLVGSLNISGARALISEGGKSEMSAQIQSQNRDMIQSSEIGRVDLKSATSQPEVNDAGLEVPLDQVSDVGIQAEELTTAESPPKSIPVSENTAPIAGTVVPSSGNHGLANNKQVRASGVAPSHIVPSEGCGCGGGKPKPLVYALGTLNYDFGTEARRDSFMQLMPNTGPSGEFPPNPFDANQMVNYLRGVLDDNGQVVQPGNPSEAANLNWTLNIELTPLYAIEPVGPYADLVYERLVAALGGQILPDDNDNFVSRVSIPGYLSGTTMTLFSGQVVPVVIPQIRGLFTWNTTALVNGILEELDLGVAEEQRLRDALEGFLNRIYFDLRNLGQTSSDRALNYAATNAFQATDTLQAATGLGMQLDTIDVGRSPFCRMDSDCWDVRLTFFDPENNQRARRVYRFTIDVSDLMPVTVGEVRSWPIS